MSLLYSVNQSLSPPRQRFLLTFPLIAFPHLEETESKSLNLQMELIKLKNNEQLMKKLNYQKNLRPKKTGHVERCNWINKAAKGGQKTLILVRSSVFKHEIFEKQVPNPIAKHWSGGGTTADGSH